MLADVDTFFAVELPSIGEWRFTREDARRISQPILSIFGSESVRDWVGRPEVQARVWEWMPQGSRLQARLAALIPVARPNGHRVAAKALTKRTREAQSAGGAWLTLRWRHGSGMDNEA